MSDPVAPNSVAPGPVAEAMRRKLTDAFAPSALTIEDESDQHAGHAGHSGAGESHFHVAISAPAFLEMSRIDRHRAVTDVLKDELAGPVHALRLTVSAS